MRRYARFLSLNEDEAVEWFKEMVSPAEHEVEDISLGDGVKPKWKWPAVKWQTVLAAVIFLVLAIWLGKIVVGYIAHNVEENRSLSPTAPVEQAKPSAPAGDSHGDGGASQGKPGSRQENTAGNEEENRTDMSSGAVDRESTPTPGGVEQPAKKVTVKLRATDRSWVSIYVDGEKAFSGIMNANEETQVSGYKVTLTIGNAGGVLVTVDGKDLGYLGKSGEVVRNKVFTNES